MSRFGLLSFLILSVLALVPQGDARAEIPAARFSYERDSLKIEGALVPLENSGDAQEFVQGFRNEISKLRKSNPALEVRIHWVDAVRESVDRGLASSDNVDDLARDIAKGDPSLEVDGHRIAIPELKDSAGHKVLCASTRRESCLSPRTHDRNAGSETAPSPRRGQRPTIHRRALLRGPRCSRRSRCLYRRGCRTPPGGPSCTLGIPRTTLAGFPDGRRRPRRCR